MSSSPSPPRAAAPVSADIGIVAALGIEFAPLLAKLTNVRKYAGKKFSVVEGEYGGQLIAVAFAGAGRARAQRGAEILLDGHRPRWLISAGFAGALDPSLRRNEIVLASEVVNSAGRKYAIDVTLPPDAAAQGLRTGRLLTVDEIVRTRAQKEALRRDHAADIVDMETSAVAALCEQRGVRFLSVRVISDDTAHDLPPEILAIFGRTGEVSVGGVLGVLVKRPSSVKDLLKFRAHANQAAEALGRFLLGALPQLG